MDMINLDVQFHYLTFLLLRKCSDTSLNLLCYFSCQYPISILRDKYDMILAAPYRL